MNGENRPMGPAPSYPPAGGGVGPAPMPDNSSTPTGASGPSSEPPPPPSGAPQPSGILGTPQRPSGPPGGFTPSRVEGPPPPPPPQIDIRTMASDAESLKASGGLGAEPKTFSPADLAKEPVFASEIVSPAGASPRTGTSSKKFGLAAGALGILVVAAAVGYFFVWPLFSEKEESQETVATPPPAVPVLPTETQPPAPAPAAVRQSLFAKAPDAVEEENLATLTASEINSSIIGGPGADSESPLEDGSIQEVVFKVDKESVSAESFLKAVLPASGLETFFESNFTAFVYYSNETPWPGYVFKIKSSADLKAAEAAVAANERSANLATLYPKSPGAPKGVWRDGTVGATKTRYLVYTSPGASLNYGWVDNNYLVISTSFEGFKKAVDLLPR